MSAKENVRGRKAPGREEPNNENRPDQHSAAGPSKATVASADRAVSPEIAANVPAELQALPAWLVWKYGPPDQKTGKRAKVPYYAGTPRKRNLAKGREADRARLTTFDKALQSVRNGDHDGIGLAMFADQGIVAADFDRKAGTIAPLTDDEVATLCAGTYLERSPSGNGYRAFWLGAMDKITGGARGIEIFPDGQFVTVTGNRLPDAPSTVAPLPDAVRSELLALSIKKRAPVELASVAPVKPPLGIDIAAAQEVLSHVPFEWVDGYPGWIRAGMALHHEFAGSQEALNLWDSWSQGSPEKYAKGPDTCEDKWSTFGRPDTGRDEVTMRTVIGAAKANGWAVPSNMEQAIQAYDSATRSAKEDVHFNLRSATDYMKNYRNDMPPVLGVACLVGVTLVAGIGGGGKSTVAATWAAHVTNGLPCIPWEHSTAQRAPAGVLWLTVEESLGDMVMPRHAALGGNTDLMFVPEIERKQDSDGKWVADTFDVEKHLRELLEQAGARGTPIRLVVCDSLPGLVQWEGRSANSDTDVKQMIGGLSQVAYEYGCCIVGIAHWNKKTELAEEHRMSGAQAWRETPRVSFTCERGFIYINKSNDVVELGCTFEQQVVKVLKEIQAQTEDGKPIQVTARRAAFGEHILPKERVLELQKAERSAVPLSKAPTRHDRMCAIVRELFDMLGSPLPSAMVWDALAKEHVPPNGAEKVAVRNTLNLVYGEPGKRTLHTSGG